MNGRRLTIGIFTAFFVGSVWGFPPAPYYSLYGTVRDQVGQRLRAEGAVLVLLKGAKEVGRTQIQSGLWIDQNYELKMPIDMNRSSTKPYTSGAIGSAGAFSLVVEMNGERFYPIEVSGDLTAGTGGERVELDLNLGEDSDGDGLPDIWEQWQLFQSGLRAGASGWDLSLIDRDGDYDKDGDSNYSEYLAGTFAGDNTETFTWELKALEIDRVGFDLFAITGKIYTLDRSVDGVSWERVAFSVGEDGEAEKFYEADHVGVTRAYHDGARAERHFYRLSVR